MNPTICCGCGHSMSPGAERPPSMGNPNQCVPCATGIDFPAPGAALSKAQGGANNLPCDSESAAGSSGAAPGSLTAPGFSFPGLDSCPCTDGNGDGVHATVTFRPGDYLLPPVTAPVSSPGMRASVTTATGGNPFPLGRWTDTTVQPGCKYCEDDNYAGCGHR